MARRCWSSGPFCWAEGSVNSSIEDRKYKRCVNLYNFCRLIHLACRDFYNWLEEYHHTSCPSSYFATHWFRWNDYTVSSLSQNYQKRQLKIYMQAYESKMPYDTLRVSTAELILIPSASIMDCLSLLNKVTTDPKHLDSCHRVFTVESCCHKSVHS